MGITGDVSWGALALIGQEMQVPNAFKIFLRLPLTLSEGFSA